MQIIRVDINKISDLLPLSPSVMTMGNFDGVHRGHQKLLQTCVEMARAANLPACVITFDPYPAEFFNPQEHYMRIQAPIDKYQALAAQGVDRCIVLRFNSALAKCSADNFVQELLCKHFQCKGIVVGDDFRYGAQRAGDFAHLSAALQDIGIAAQQLEQQQYQGRRISSSWVREACLSGDMNLVTELLGRPWSLTRRVVYGDQRGRLLGFPTANLVLPNYLRACRGVYVVKVAGEVAGKDWQANAVANFGCRPTVDGEQWRCEVHLLDQERNLYAQRIKVSCLSRLRAEIKFKDLDELKLQINKDAQQAREWFLQT